MRRHQKNTKYILPLVLLTFILSIDYSYPKKPGKWKPGNENDRRFPIDRTLQIDKRNPIDRTLQNDERVPIDRTLQYDRRIPFDKTLQNDRRIPIVKTLQNNRRIPIDRTLQNDTEIPIDRTLQNYRRIPIDRTLQNYRSIPIDRTLQNYEKNPIDRTVQNDRRNPTYKTNQTDADGLMQKIKRIKINKILEQDHNDLKKKIDRLLQNGNLQINNRVQDGGRMLTNRRMQNFENTQNNLKVQNSSDELQKMINAKRIGYDKRMWAANFHPILRDKQSTTAATGKNMTGITFEDFTDSDDELQNVTWAHFLDVVGKMVEDVDSWQPNEQVNLNIRACYSIATTYISAHHDFKRYYERRSLYENNIEFEVGYLVSEIVSKYQRMLELYNMAIDYYFKKTSKNYMPSTYMLYMYTNVLEMGTVITHLCNMLAEIEDKYNHIPAPMSGFSDYHLLLLPKDKDTPEVRKAREEAEYNKYMNLLLNSYKKNKKNERKKTKDKPLEVVASVATTPDRKPKYNKHWKDRIYGWSIEYYW